MGSLLCDASGEYVEIASSSSLDNMLGTSTLSGAVTTAAWVYRTGTSTADTIWYKGGGGGYIYFDFGASAGYECGFYYQGSTSNVRARCNRSQLTHHGINKWMFIAAQLDTTSASNCRIFCGDLTNPCAEATGYQSQGAGSGTHTSEATYPLRLGAESAGGSPIDGRIAWVGIWKSALGIDVLKQLQFRPHVYNSTCVLFMWPGRFADASSTQPDFSGNRNNGTVTNATLVDGLPLGKFQREGHLWVPKTTAVSTFPSELLAWKKKYAGTYIRM